MQNKSENNKPVPWFLLLSIVSLLFTVPTATSVFAMQLTVPMTVSANNQPLPPATDDSVTVVNGATRRPTVEDMRKTPKAGGLLAEIIDTASKNNHLLLWNMYPAGIRGRVFGGNGEDPTFAMALGQSGWN